MLEASSLRPRSSVPPPPHTLPRGNGSESALLRHNGLLLPFSAPPPVPRSGHGAQSSLSQERAHFMQLIASWVPRGDPGPPPSCKQLLHSGEWVPAGEAGQGEAAPGRKATSADPATPPSPAPWLTPAKAFRDDPLTGDSMFWNAPWGPVRRVPRAICKDKVSTAKCPHGAGQWPSRPCPGRRSGACRHRNAHPGGSRPGARAGAGGAARGPRHPGDRAAP